MINWLEYYYIFHRSKTRTDDKSKRHNVHPRRPQKNRNEIKRLIENRNPRISRNTLDQQIQRFSRQNFIVLVWVTVYSTSFCTGGTSVLRAQKLAVSLLSSKDNLHSYKLCMFTDNLIWQEISLKLSDFFKTKSVSFKP